MIKSIGILLFDDIELLDFAGPLEVFSVADHIDTSLNLRVTTIGFKDVIRVSKSGLKVIPQTKISDSYDLLIIPGGIGTREIIKDVESLEKITKLIKVCRIAASVCTGALILGKLGYLKGLSAITHKNGIEELKQLDSSIIIQETERYIDNGKIITSGGISAGIDMSLHLIEKYFSLDLKNKITEYMEYARC